MQPGSLPANIGVVQRTDTRAQPVQGTGFSVAPPAVVVGYNDVGTSLSGIIFYAAPSQNVDTEVLAHDVILRPGSQLVVSLDSASPNIAWAFSVNGYDRPAEPEDLR
jgi:hypothetical protein